MSENLITLDNAHLTLGKGSAAVHVLKGMSVEIGRGESVGILGPSGSGKSTLLMVIAGLERLDSGEITIDGTALSGLSEDALAAFRGENIGIVFQSFHLISNMTALENTAIPLELAGRADAFERARAALESVGLGHRLTHYPGQLSGGEQQRVAIARAVANAPRLLLADEPTGNLDPQTASYVFEALEALVRQSGLSALIATHNLDLAARMDRQVTLDDGQVVPRVI